MIALTRLDGRELVVNLDHVTFVEATPDTCLTLRSGDRLMVREAVDEVVRRAVEFRRQVAPPWGKE
jgi:flagellar protein FlbD